MTSNEIPGDITLYEQLSKLSGTLDQIAADLQKHRPAVLPSTTFENAYKSAQQLNGMLKKIKDMEEECRYYRALAGIGQVINSSLELDIVLRIVMDTIIKMTGAERGFLMLRDEEGRLVTQTARNWEQESIPSADSAISRTVINRVVEEEKPILTTNAQEDPRFGGHDSVVAFNLRSIMCVPLVVKAKLTGLIYADNRARSGIFTQRDLSSMMAFADQAAVAIENARLFASVSHTLAEVTALKSLMDNIFASIASGVITADVEEKIMMCNRAAEFILGRGSSDLIGKSLMDVIPKDISGLVSYVIKVLKTDQSVIGVEFNPIFPDRGQVDLRLNLSPLKDASQVTQGVAIVLDDLTEKKHLEAQHRLFERMVSPAVIHQLDPDQLALGGRRMDITVLFADIRGFTSFSESVDPVNLVMVLNQYLAAAADAVLSQEGTIDKFLGDAVMAWFNAPILQEDHTLRAVKAAMAIRASVDKLHLEMPRANKLSFGVGIHYGEAVLGLVGTEKRMEYTAIGDSVNTTKRIQENTAPGQILISAEAYQRVKDHVVAHPVEAIQAKGKRSPVAVYEILEVINSS